MGSRSNRIVKGLLRWAKVSRDGDDEGNYPIQQVTYLGKVGDALMWFPYGFHAVIPDDTLAVMLALQGNTEARVCLPGSPTLRPRIASDEVVVYHPPTGSKIHFRSDGDIEVSGVDLRVTATDSITVTAENDIDVTSTTGDVNVVATSGQVTIDAPNIEAALGATLRLMNEGIITKFNTHFHGGSGSAPNASFLFDSGDRTSALKGS